MCILVLPVCKVVRPNPYTDHQKFLCWDRLLALLVLHSPLPSVQSSFGRFLKRPLLKPSQNPLLAGCHLLIYAQLPSLRNQRNASNRVYPVPPTCGLSLQPLSHHLLPFLSVCVSPLISRFDEPQVTQKSLDTCQFSWSFFWASHSHSYLHLHHCHAWSDPLAPRGLGDATSKNTPPGDRI